MRNAIYFYALIVPLLFSCGDDSSGQDVNTNGGDTTTDWLIPIQEVRDGGPGRDGIPALSNPKFITTDDATYLSDSDLIIGVKNGNTIRAYPHLILDWHEIVNDDIGDLSLAVTYCPLTGTAIGWDRIIEGTDSATTFGVSGLLYNTNLIPFDRATSSNWTQIGLECVNGPLIGKKIKVKQVIETSWGVWKGMYPNTEVLSTDTGFSRNYGAYPYGDYRTNNSNFIFPVQPLDNRLPSKQRVHAVLINEESKIYTFNSFSEDTILKDTFEGRDLLLVGNTDFIVSFELTPSQNELTFSFDLNADQVFVDNEGTGWNLFGEAISGVRKGEKLESTTSFMAYFFSVGAFYDIPELFQ